MDAKDEIGSFKKMGQFIFLSNIMILLQLVKQFGVPKSISAPLIIDDHVIGVLTVQSNDLHKSDFHYSNYEGSGSGQWPIPDGRHTLDAGCIYKSRSLSIYVHPCERSKKGYDSHGQLLLSISYNKIMNGGEIHDLYFSQF